MRNLTFLKCGKGEDILLLRKGGIVEIVVEYSAVVSFVVCYLALVCVSKTLKQDCGKVALPAMFCAAVSVFYPILQGGLVVKVLLLVLSVIFSVLLSFQWLGWENFIVESVMLFGFVCLFGGVCSWVENFIGKCSLFVVCLIVFVCYIVLTLVVKYVSNTRKIQSFSFNLKIVDNGREILEEGYLDSGNVLVDRVSGKPVVLINFDVFHKLYNNVTFAFAI